VHEEAVDRRPARDGEAVGEHRPVAGIDVLRVRRAESGEHAEGPSGDCGRHVGVAQEVAQGRLHGRAEPGVAAPHRVEADRLDRGLIVALSATSARPTMLTRRPSSSWSGQVSSSTIHGMSRSSLPSCTSQPRPATNGRPGSGPSPTVRRSRSPIHLPFARKTRSAAMIPWSVSTPSTAPYSASGNARLLALVEVQHDVADRYVRILLASFDYRDRSQREHRDLLDAARGGRVEAAVAVLRRHLREGMETLVAALGAQR
jgi:hypothetical protein